MCYTMAFLVKLFLFINSCTLVYSKVQEICEQKGQYITCPFGQLLTINSVQYGRTRTGNCNPYRVANLPTNCHSTQISTNTVKRLCEAKTGCFLEADNTILGEDPCKNIPKYLTVEYACYVPTTTNKFITTPSTTTSTTTRTTSSTTTSTTTRRTTPTTTSSTSTTTRRTTPTTTSTTSTTTRSTPTTRTTRNPTTTKTPVVPFSPFNAPPGSQVCHDYLLTGKNGVKSGQLTASSVFNTGNPRDNHGPDRGKLFSDAIRYSNGDYDRGAWVAANNDQQQYIQVQLNSPSMIRGVATQGRHVNPNDLCCYQHVTKYRVMYSLDCVNFETVKDKNGNDMVFPGNQDQDSVVTHMLPCSIMARCVRINPLEWKDHIALRFDLLGCPAQTPDLGKCPKGWIERPGSNQCYIITDVNDMRTRDDASAQCQLQQGHLVKIDSIAERDWIRQKVAYLQHTQGQHHFWTGLSNRPRTDNTGHVWHDSTPIDSYIMPWGQGQPDNSGGNEHCGELWDGDMNDNDCNQHYPYICEKSKFWKPPQNTPRPFVRIPTTRRTPPTTARRTFAPPPTARPYQRPLLPGSQVINGIVYSTGCLGQQTDCSLNPAGDYQSCQGCHYYMTCAPSGVFVRPCPANLVWDDNLKTCNMRSSTCGPLNG